MIKSGFNFSVSLTEISHNLWKMAGSGSQLLVADHKEYLGKWIFKIFQTGRLVNQAGRFFSFVFSFVIGRKNDLPLVVQLESSYWFPGWKLQANSSARKITNFTQQKSQMKDGLWTNFQSDLFTLIIEVWLETALSIQKHFRNRITVWRQMTEWLGPSLIVESSYSLSQQRWHLPLLSRVC